MYLSDAERYAIWGLLKAGNGVRAIARVIGRSPSTVSREIRKGQCDVALDRGRYSRTYDPGYAALVTARRCAKKGPAAKIASDMATAAAIDEQIIEHGRSPYAAVEICRRNGTLFTDLSYKTVYNYIRSGVLMATSSDLPRGLSPRKRKPAFGDRRQSARRLGKSIEERPRSVLTRQEFGHWEGDLVLGGRGGREAVLTLVERKTRYLIGLKIPSRRSESVLAALSFIEDRLQGAMPRLFRSITFDNGSEFADAEAIMRSSRSPGAKRVGDVYYAHPYCSSERGSNECANGFIRRRHPKGVFFETVSQSDIDETVRWINTCPRRLLGGRTASDEFEKHSSAA